MVLVRTVYIILQHFFGTLEKANGTLGKRIGTTTVGNRYKKVVLQKAMAVVICIIMKNACVKVVLSNEMETGVGRKIQFIL